MSNKSRAFTRDVFFVKRIDPISCFSHQPQCVRERGVVNNQNPNSQLDILTLRRWKFIGHLSPGGRCPVGTSLDI